MKDEENTGAGHRAIEFSRRNLAILPLGAAAAVVAGTGMAASTGAHAQSGTQPPSDTPSLQERAAIDDLFTQYLWAYDCSDTALFLSLFVEEDPLVIGLGKPHRGKPAMADWFAYLLDIRDRENALWLHQAAHHVYRRHGDHWLVYSYATHFSYSPDAKSYDVRSLGYFVSELVPAGAGFRFRRFSITHWDKAALPWSKPLPWAEADGSGKQ